MTPSQIIAKVRKLRPLASEHDSLDAQRQALKRRAEALTRIWNWERAGVQDDNPNGFWEENDGFWCFCAYKPQGHFCEEPDCLFTDGQPLSWMCPSCRRPARINLSHGRTYHDYGSTVACEHWTQIETECCGMQPVLPNGDAGKAEDFE